MVGSIARAPRASVGSLSKKSPQCKMQSANGIYIKRQREKRDAGKNREDEETDVDSKASVDVLDSVVEASPWCRILVFQSADYLVVLSSLAICVPRSSRVVQYGLCVRQRALDAKVLDGYSPRNIPRMLGSWKAATAGTVELPTQSTAQD